MHSEGKTSSIYCRKNINHQLKKKNTFKDVISPYLSASKEKITLIERKNKKPTASK
jgi:hypothetical protein